VPAARKAAPWISAADDGSVARASDTDERARAVSAGGALRTACARIRVMDARVADATR